MVVAEGFFLWKKSPEVEHFLRHFFVLLTCTKEIIKGKNEAKSHGENIS